MAKHKCIRGCYYLQRLWKTGEVIEETPGFEDAPPNKHFAAIGSPEATAAGKEKAKTAGDDPRSTREMIDILKSHSIEVDESMSRKKIFAKLIKIENAGLKDPGAPVKAPVFPAKVEVELPGKPVSQLSPDELEATRNKDLATMILRDRGAEVSSVGRSKADLFDIDLKLANEQTDPA